MVQYKPLVIYIIVQEMQHHQLVAGLRMLGFGHETYCLSLLEVIQPLLGIPMPERGLPEVSDELGSLYYKCLKQAEQYPITLLGSELEQLAEKCYQLLVAQIHLESKRE